MLSKTILMAVAILALAGVGFLVWNPLKGGQMVTWTTPTGQERGIAMPKIPGLNLISEEKGNCSYQANYLYELLKDVDLSDKMKGAFKDAFLKRGWALSKEEATGLEFYTEKAGTHETMKLGTSFENGKGTALSLDYRWPPCSTGQ